MKKSNIIVISIVIIAAVIVGVFLINQNKTSLSTVPINENDAFKITVNNNAINKYSDFIYDYFKLTGTYVDDMHQVYTIYKESKLGDTLDPKYIENFPRCGEFIMKNNAKIKQTADDLKALLNIDDSQVKTQKFIDILEENYALNLEIIGSMNDYYHPMIDYVRWYCGKFTPEDFSNPLYISLNDAHKKVEDDTDLMGFNITEIYKVIQEYKKTKS